MNVEAISRDNFEFRSRFGGGRRQRAVQTKWQIAGKTASDAASYLRESFEGAWSGNYSSQPLYMNDIKKKNFREKVRYYAAYLGLFLLSILVFTIYLFSSTASLDDEVFAESDAFRSFAETAHSDSFFSFEHLEKHISAHVNQPPEKSHKNWRKKIFDLRPDDVINHRYDNFVISIMVADDPTENHLLQACFKTFLRQINRIQICTENIANTFVGGNHFSDVAFDPKSAAFPKLERYIDGFLSMNTFSPQKEWYMQIDEDSYLFLENIYVYLQKFQSSDALFFHNFDLVRTDSSVHYQAAKETRHFPVSIMSRRAAEILGQSKYGDCVFQNKYIGSEETILVKCLESFGVKTVTEPKLHASEPSHDFVWPVDSCKRPLSLSQLSQTQLDFLFRARPASGVASDGRAYRWDSIVTYSDVFHHTFASGDAVAGLDRHSASDSQSISGLQSGMECMRACMDDKDCVSWTFDRIDCYTSAHIGASIRRNGVVSGIVPSRYNCLAPRFR